MPLTLIDGALATHPIVGVQGVYSRNAYYDARVQSLRAVDAATLAAKLEHLGAKVHEARPQSARRRAT